MTRVTDFISIAWAALYRDTAFVFEAIPTSGEFWSGIIGAIVGGVISFAIQLKTIQEAQKQRDDDRLQARQALGNSLLFKVIRIHSDLYSINQQIGACFTNAARDGFKGEPWQFVIPLANFPAPVHFSADEMGMLLGLKANAVFEELSSLDAMHNSLIETAKRMSAERIALTERLEADRAEGNVLSGELDRKSLLALRPQIIAVNSLIQNVQAEAESGAKASWEAAEGLNKILQNHLGLTYRLEHRSPGWQTQQAGRQRRTT